MMLLDATSALSDIRHSLGELVPELYLVALLSAVLLTDLVRPRSFRLLTGYLSMGGLLALLGWLLVAGPPVRPHAAMLGMLTDDAVAWYLRLLLTGCHILALLPALRQHWPERTGKGEYFVMLLALHLGLHIMVVARHFLPMYVGMELASLSSYVLVGYLRTQRAGSEASVKYLLYGAFSSGILLYGLSLLYGLGGSMSLAPGELATALAQAPPRALLVALGLTLVGFGFKAALMPFHFWAPDVYQGGGWPIATLLATGSKVAAFGLLLRFMVALPPQGDWLHLLLAIGMGGMVLGNVAAFTQKNYRRLLAYSGIAHSGLLLVATLQPGTDLKAGLLLYTLAYILMTALAFYAGYLLSRHTGHEDYTQWAGVSATGGGLPALLLVIAMVALSGLPPTVGFVAKLNIFLPLWSWYTASGDSWVLAALIVAVVTTVLGLFYYLRPPLYAILRKGGEYARQTYAPDFWILLGGLALATAVLLLGLWGWDAILRWLSAP